MIDDQLPLFRDDKDIGSWRHGDPETSKAAARGVKAAKLRKLVLAILQTKGPCTSEEVTNHLNKDLGSITPRFKELERAGLAHRTLLKRPGKTGSMRIVWAAGPPPNLY